MLCTGQTPNTDIMKSFLPDSVIPDGPSKNQIRVTRTLQIGVPIPASATPSSSVTSGKSVGTQESDEEEEEEDPQYTVPYPHIFAIGDAADAFGAINAGHTAYLQGEVAARNILKMIQVREEGQECSVEELERYKPGPPAIKVSLGLVSLLIYVIACMRDKEPLTEYFFFSMSSRARHAISSVEW